MSVSLSALCALLQLMVVPGLIVQRLIFPPGSRIAVADRWLLTFCGSALCSFLLLLLLHQAGLQQRWVWVCVGVVECVALLLPARKQQLDPPLFSLPHWSTHWLNRCFVVAYAVALLILAITVLSHWPGVLEGWDAIISWNRWARDWAQGDWPFLTWGYAQLIPALWSILYLWQDSTEIEVFLRAWLGSFPLLLMLTMWARSKSGAVWAPLLAGSLLVWVLLASYLYVLDTGYVDVPVTCFVLLAAHWVLLAGEDPANGKRWLLCAAISAAAATLVKASGLLAVAIWLYGAWAHRGSGREKLALLALLFALIAPWYGLHWFNGTHEDVAAYVTDHIYGAETLPQRMARALTSTLPALLLPGSGVAVRCMAAVIAAAGLLTALKSARGRFYAVPGLAYLLAWAALLSYDGRNLLPGLPLLVLAIFTGFEQLVSRWVRPDNAAASPGFDKPRPRPAFAYDTLLPALLLALFLLGIFPLQDKSAWEQQTDTLRKQSGDAELNRQLIDFVNTPAFSGFIYTTYPQLASIAALRQALFVDYGASHMQPQTAAALSIDAPLCSILRSFPRFETIHYLLLHDSVYPVVIDNALQDSSLQVVMSWPGLRLLQVNCWKQTAADGRQGA